MVPFHVAPTVSINVLNPAEQVYRSVTMLPLATVDQISRLCYHLTVHVIMTRQPERVEAAQAHDTGADLCCVNAAFTWRQCCK